MCSKKYPLKMSQIAIMALLKGVLLKFTQKHNEAVQNFFLSILSLFAPLREIIRKAYCHRYKSNLK